MPSIDIGGLRVAYEDAGTGLPIVFIPGLTGTKDWFTYQFRGLRDSYRIISYDVRAARSAALYGLDLLVDDLARLLTALRLNAVVVAGHSFGGMIAQRFAVQYPQRVHALILVSAFPSLAEACGDALLEWMSPGTPPAEPGLRALLRRFFGLKPPAPPEDSEGLEWLAGHGGRVTGTTLHTRIALVEKFNSTRWLPRIEAPTLIIVGANDRPSFLAGGQLLYEGVPDATLEVVEDGDHYCFFTRHDIVNGVIDDFLTQRTTDL